MPSQPGTHDTVPARDTARHVWVSPGPTPVTSLCLGSAKVVWSHAQDPESQGDESELLCRPLDLEELAQVTAPPLGSGHSSLGWDDGACRVSSGDARVSRGVRPLRTPQLWLRPRIPTLRLPASGARAWPLPSYRGCHVKIIANISLRNRGSHPAELLENRRGELRARERTPRGLGWAPRRAR